MAARSKLKNFAPKILLCAERGVLSIRNANIVSDGKASELGVLNFELAPCPEGTRIYQKPTASSEGAQLWDKHPLTLSWFRKAGPTIILNIIVDASVPLRGTIWDGSVARTHSCAASQLAVGL